MTDTAVKIPEIEASSDALMRRTICVNPDATRALDTYCAMLTYKRPGGSKTERAFIKQFLHPYDVKNDRYGNYFKKIGDAPVLWSCHIDTVHERKGIQAIGYDDMEIGVAADDKSGSSCLGADNTTGVWEMLELIRAKVPGLYIFHRDEETGRKGSKFIAEFGKPLIRDMQFAIALDRKGTDNLITHQSGQRGCSAAFANNLIEQLKASGLEYKADDSGSYTDTFSYFDLIGECTNLSVGYKGQHTKWERQDVGHMFKLRDALIALDLSKLVAERKPGEKEYKQYHYNTYNYSNARRAAQGYDDNTYDEWGYTWDIATQQFVYNANHQTRHDHEYSLPNYTSGSTLKGTASGTQVGATTVIRKDLGVTALSKEAREYVEQQKKIGENTKRIADLQKGNMHKVAAAIKEEKDDDDEGFGNGGTAEDFELMVKLVTRNPECVADILEQYGLDFAALRDEILQLYGVVNC